MAVILKVANIHFDVAGTSRLEYLGSNVIGVTANTGGIRVAQNSAYPTQANTLSIGTTNRTFGNLYIGSNRTIDFGNNTTLTQNSKGTIIKGAPSVYFDKPIKNADGDTIQLGAPTFQLFSANGTWTKPVGCRYIKVMCIGGGGGGGGASYVSTNLYSAGSGGSSGSIGIKWLDVSNWSNTTTVTVGAGGAAGSSSPGTGSDGGTSSFGTHISSPGGGGGLAMTGAASVAVRRGGYNDLTSTGADVNLGSNAGYPSHRMSGTIGASGRGGEGLFGGATGSYILPSITSYDGVYGGGGSGATSGSATSNSGGTGGTGCVYIEEFY